MDKIYTIYNEFGVIAFSTAKYFFRGKQLLIVKKHFLYEDKGKKS